MVVARWVKNTAPRKGDRASEGDIAPNEGQYGAASGHGDGLSTGRAFKDDKDGACA